MYSVIRTQLNAQGELSTYFPLSHSVNFSLFHPSVLILRVLVTLVFLRSAYSLNPGSLPVSAFVLPLHTVAWKCSQSSRLGQSQGSLHFPSCVSGPLLFLDWFTVFCRLLFPIYVAGIRINLATVTSSQSEAKLSLALSFFFFQEAATVDMSEPLPTREETQPSPTDSLFWLMSARPGATALHAQWGQA